MASMEMLPKVLPQGHHSVVQFCETEFLFFGESVVLSFLSTPSPKFTPARPRSKVWRGHGDPTIISYLLNGVDYL